MLSGIFCECQPWRATIRLSSDVPQASSILGGSKIELASSSVILPGNRGPRLTKRSLALSHQLYHQDSFGAYYAIITHIAQAAANLLPDPAYCPVPRFIYPQQGMDDAESWEPPCPVPHLQDLQTAPAHHKPLYQSPDLLPDHPYRAGGVFYGVHCFTLPQPDNIHQVEEGCFCCHRQARLPPPGGAFWPGWCRQAGRSNQLFLCSS